MKQIATSIPVDGVATIEINKLLILDNRHNILLSSEELCCTYLEKNKGVIINAPPPQN